MERPGANADDNSVSLVNECCPPRPGPLAFPLVVLDGLAFAPARVDVDDGNGDDGGGRGWQ
jgi:hypothetical protein